MLSRMIRRCNENAAIVPANSNSGRRKRAPQRPLRCKRFGGDVAISEAACNSVVKLPFPTLLGSVALNLARSLRILTVHEGDFT